jgi:steroid 5-alpha reductase family enzyme
MAVTWAITAIAMVALWFLQRRTRNAAVVDAGWSYSFAIAAIVFAFGGTAPRAQTLPLTLMVLMWSIRLGTYLLKTRVLGEVEEEGRYVTLRRRWAPNVDRAFFLFFQAQAALAALLTIAFVLPYVDPAPGIRALRWLAVFVFSIGLTGEAMADAQLHQFKRDPTNRGRVCDVGLWRLSRHPNYFFEWLIWVSFFLYSLNVGGWIAIVAPAIILYTLFRVTGIPATEAQARRSRGEAYRRYQATTSSFVPWFPRPTAHHDYREAP